MKRLLSITLLLVSVVACGAETPPATPGMDADLEQQLLQHHKADQEARNAMREWIMKNGTNGSVNTDTLSPERKAEFQKIEEGVKKTDSENTAWLKTVVDKNGWPTVTMVGQEGAHSAWILVQHADADVKFQRHCLDLMTKLPKEEISLPSVAFLTDRVLLAEGKKQLYGTQFTSVEGKFQPKPLEDEANLDQRRAEMGLPPMADYVKHMEQQYHGGGGK